ncbi:helix-turn-helix transcriptional regulator [Micromonospora sp. NPDC005367]|uniref:helix-turn-helix domain-containing protein n=1 Tax=Micromonospora sp. NPDC005367 TaxID=3155590 RepID=UPI0033ABCF05
MSDGTPSERAVGRRIAFYRQRRGLSQREFARLIDRSETWLSQVERGVRKIDRMTVLERLAGVLEVPLSELAPEAPVVAAAHEELPAATELGLALSSSHALAAVLGTSHEPADVDELSARVAEAWTYTHASEFSQVGAMLVGLLPDLETAARTTEGEAQQAVFAALARAYHACAAVLARMAEPGAAWVAADRAISAAERSGDALLMAEGAFRLTLVFQAARRLDRAQQTAATAAAALEDRAEAGEPEALSIWGALHLQLAVVAARRNDAEAAYEELAIARRAAERLGVDRNDYNTEFGSTNVALHEVAVAVELGDAGRALRGAANVDPSSLSPERQGRFLIDVARAHAQRRNVPGVVETLSRAVEVAPELAPAHPLVQRLVTDMLRSDLADEPGLRELADRLGLSSAMPSM